MQLKQMRRLLPAVTCWLAFLAQRAAYARPEAGKMPLDTGLERPFWMSPWIVMILVLLVWSSYFVTWRNLARIRREGQRETPTVSRVGSASRNL